MSFTGHKALDEDDFYTSLVKNPQPVAVLDVGELYDGEKDAQKYFYIKMIYVVLILKDVNMFISFLLYILWAYFKILSS